MQLPFPQGEGEPRLEHLLLEEPPPDGTSLRAPGLVLLNRQLTWGEQSGQRGSHADPAACRVGTAGRATLFRNETKNWSPDRTQKRRRIRATAGKARGRPSHKGAAGRRARSTPRGALSAPPLCTSARVCAWLLHGLGTLLVSGALTHTELARTRVRKSLELSCTRSSLEAGPPRSTQISWVSKEHQLLVLWSPVNPCWCWEELLPSQCTGEETEAL